MSVEISKEGWMQLFTQMREPTNFLTRFFKMRPGNSYSGNKVAIDIKRYGEKIAVAVTKRGGPNLNVIDEFTTKEFIPPSYHEATVVDVLELLDRMAGVNPYDAAYSDYASDLVVKIAEAMVEMDAMIQRSVELQASQVLQTGKLTLKDSAGNTVYELDFKPKAAHFPTVGTSWSAAGADPLGDLKSLSKEIRKNGKVAPDTLLFGSTAIDNFYKNQDVIDLANSRRIERIEIKPELLDSGATFHGTINIGSYTYQIWEYPQYYEDPQTSNLVPYIEDDKVVMLSSRTRLDVVSAKVPLPVGPDPRVSGFLPGRMVSNTQGYDVTPNIYVSEDGKQIKGALESRPLLVPVQIDGFGCLDTKI